MRLVDLSHVIEHRMTTYPGLPGPVISAHLTFEESAGVYAAGTEFAIGRIDMVGNTGTYLDTPAHRFRQGHDLSGLALERCVDLPTLVLTLDGAIGANELTTALEAGPGLGAARGAAVLLHTGWDRHWGTEAYGDPVHPHVTSSGARLLSELGAVLVGIDSVNIDDTTGGNRPAHTELLGAGVVVVEHLTGLAGLPATGARFTAVPPAIRGLATFPVRAFATVP